MLMAMFSVMKGIWGHTGANIDQNSTNLFISPYVNFTSEEKICEQMLNSPDGVDVEMFRGDVLLLWFTLDALEVRD